MEKNIFDFDIWFRTYLNLQLLVFAIHIHCWNCSASLRLRFVSIARKRTNRIVCYVYSLDGWHWQTFNLTLTMCVCAPSDNINWLARSHQRPKTLCSLQYTLYCYTIICMRCVRWILIGRTWLFDSIWPMNLNYFILDSVFRGLLIWCVHLSVSLPRYIHIMKYDRISNPTSVRIFLFLADKMQVIQMHY